MIQKIFVNIADFTCVTFWAQTVLILLDQYLLIPLDQNVSVVFVSNLYNRNIGVAWSCLVMSFCCSFVALLLAQIRFAIWYCKLCSCLLGSLTRPWCGLLINVQFCLNNCFFFENSCMELSFPVWHCLVFLQYFFQWNYFLSAFSFRY